MEPEESSLALENYKYEDFNRPMGITQHENS